jgi:hypothetical protein
MNSVEVLREVLLGIIHRPDIKSYLDTNTPDLLNQIRSALDLTDSIEHLLVATNGNVIPNVATKKMSKLEAFESNQAFVLAKLNLSWVPTPK